MHTHVHNFAHAHLHAQWQAHDAATDDVIFLCFLSYFFFIRELFISILEKERLLIEFRRTYDLQRQATSGRRRKMEIKVPFLRLSWIAFNILVRVKFGVDTVKEDEDVD